MPRLISFPTQPSAPPWLVQIGACVLLWASVASNSAAQSASFSQAAGTGQEADADYSVPQARETPKKSQTLTLAQAIKHVRHATPGKILSARRIQTSQGPAYRIKVLTRTGLVRVVQVAESVAPKPEPKGE